MNKDIFAEFEGNEAFTFYIEKAELARTSDEGEIRITGCASTVNIDHDMERMAEPALERMANIINEKSVPLRVEHQKNDNAIIGAVDKAWLDDRQKLWIEAKLDKSNPAAMMLHEALKAGSKLGLSVGGRVRHATRELVESAGKMIKTFYDVILDEVSVTPRPSNYDAWLVQKHYVREDDKVAEFQSGKIYDAFLFENPRFDYLMAIEKSIPDQKWKKVEPEKENINMGIFKTKESEETKLTEEKAIDTSTDSEKTETGEETKPVEDFASKSYVDKKFADLTNLIKSSFKKTTETEATGTTREVTAPVEETTPAVDQTIPVDEKKENPAQVRTTTIKEEFAVKTGANGTTDETREMKETSPLEETPTLESSKSVTKNALRNFVASIQKASEELMNEVSDTKETDKAITDEKIESPKTESSSSSETKVEEATKDDEESSGSSEKFEDMKDYVLPELKRSARKFSNIDVLSSYIGKSIDKIEDRFAKSGKRIPGLRNVILDTIRNDEEIQKSIQSMMKEPGVKRSVSFGTAYAVTKDGQRLRLVADTSTVQKSVIDKKAKFGDVYKTYFSSESEKKA